MWPTSQLVRCRNQSEGEFVCDRNMCAGIESPIGAPHCVKHLTKHGAVDVEVSHSLSDRRKEFIEAKAQVNSDYPATARRLDTRIHSTSLSDRGPFVSTLHEYYNGGRVLGPVSCWCAWGGFFGPG